MGCTCGAIHNWTEGRRIKVCPCCSEWMTRNMSPDEQTVFEKALPLLKEMRTKSVEVFDIKIRDGKLDVSIVGIEDAGTFRIP